MSEIEVKTIDNLKIRANHLKNGHDQVVIICPGWFMTKDSKSLSNLAKDLSEICDIISMDFRGHGKSEGFYTFTAREEHDLNAVVEFAKQHYQKVSLLGFSLGGALVVLHCAKDKQIRKCIAVSAPTEFFKIENRMYSPRAWYPTLFQKFEIKRWLSIRAGNPFLKKPNPLEVVQEVETPTLFIAGEKDPTVFAWHTKALFTKANCKKSYLEFRNGNHAEDLYNDFRDEFLKACKTWLTEN